MNRAIKKSQNKADFDPSKSYIGHCQVCGHAQVVNGGLMVLHGYERPGVGYIHGRCSGENYAPFQLSCEVAKRHLAWLLTERIPETKKYIAALAADQVDELRVAIPTGYSYSGRRSRFGGNAKRTYTLKTIQRGYVHVKEGEYDYDGGKTFDLYRQDKERNERAALEQMKADAASLDKLIKGWKYAPEELVLREDAEAEEAAALEARKNARLLKSNWKELWKRVADGVRDHKDGRDYGWTFDQLAKKGVDARAFMTANPFPTDKDRKAARDRAK